MSQRILQASFIPSELDIPDMTDKSSLYDVVDTPKDISANPPETKVSITADTQQIYRRNIEILISLRKLRADKENVLPDNLVEAIDSQLLKFVNALSLLDI